jgi:DnaJ family protein C protein 11
MSAPAPHPDAIPDEALVASGAAVDVTPAVRLLVEGGRLRLGGGVPRPGLLGFCDPAPGEAKALSVRYVHGGRAYAVRLADGAPVSLPERGGAPLPAGTAEAVAVCAAAEALAAAAAAGGR